MTKKDIIRLCDANGIENYAINDDLSLNVYDSVSMQFISKKIGKIPLSFNYVQDNFYCDEKRLKSLIGFPKRIDGMLDISINQLKNLNYCPEYVSEEFFCEQNHLTSLKGISKYIGGDLYAQQNDLTSVEGLQQHFFGNISLHDNNLTSLKGISKYIDGDLYLQSNSIRTFDHFPYVKGDLYLKDNPIYELWNLFENVDYIGYFNELDIIQENGQVVILDRLNYFLQDIGKNEINENYIKNYKVVSN